MDREKNRREITIMADKGPSNAYGNSEGKPTEHINYPYAKDFNANSTSKHDEKHLSNLGVASVNEMKANAVYFANKVDKVNNISFIDKKGTTYKYSKETNELALVTQDGYVISYFKPKKGEKYYKNQEKKKKRSN